MSSIFNPLMLALFRIPWVKERWQKNFNALESTEIPWTPLSKPLSECKIALLTTGGVHLKDDVPFDMEDEDGDSSYRKIPSDTLPDDLMITHDYYDHRDADQDINLVLPVEPLETLQEQKLLGESATFFYSFMGHIAGPHLNTLVTQTAKEVAQSLKHDNVDIAFLVPA